MLTNYHTHCYRCNHAEGTEEDYVKQAIEQGFDILGMSDHVPYKGDFWGFRMTFDQLEPYIDTVRSLSEQYRNQLTVLVGFESEYMLEYRKYYERLLTNYHVDYLVLGQHFFDFGGHFQSAFDITDSADCVTYAKSVVEAMSTGWYALVAHPDIPCVNPIPWDRNFDEMTDLIIEGALRYDIPLEVNANGIRRGMVQDGLGLHYMYPHFKFWEKAAEAKVKTVVSADCHAPRLLWDSDVKRARQIAQNWNLQLTDVLPIQPKSH